MKPNTATSQAPWALSMVLGLGVLMGMPSCGTHPEPLQRALANGPEKWALDDDVGESDGDFRPSAYPVDPQVHVVDPDLDALDPGSFRPAVLNGVAYARRVAESVSPRGVVIDPEPLAIARTLARRGRRAAVPAAVLLEAHRTVAPPSAAGAYWDHLAAGSSDDIGGVSRLARALVDSEHRRDYCIEQGHTPQRCCTALALTEAVLPPWEELTEAERSALTGASVPFDVYDQIVALRVHPGVRQPFRTLAMKAWLGACEATVQEAPATLAELLDRLDADRLCDFDNPAELHPISLAKRAGRRICRGTPENVSVSIAQSLDAHCQPRETEVVHQRPDGKLDFWVFDHEGRRVTHAYFPSRPGVESVKFAPDACMGCHYTFDERQFNVQIPSYRSLQLRLRLYRGQPNWRNDAGCAQPGERQIWHERPPPL